MSGLRWGKRRDCLISLYRMSKSEALNTRETSQLPFSTAMQLSTCSKAPGSSDNNSTSKRKSSKRAPQRQPDEDDETKIMRTGSLGRIIVSSTAVNQVPTAKISTEKAPLKAGAACSKIVEAFNASDLESLSKLIRSQFHRECVLNSNILPRPIEGRQYVMMLWALFMETFPDGIWTCTKSSAKGMVITRDYNFSGTRVFLKHTSELFAYVKEKADLVQRLDPSKSSTTDIDTISEILESCWISPETRSMISPSHTAREVREITSPFGEVISVNHSSNKDGGVFSLQPWFMSKSSGSQQISEMAIGETSQKAHLTSDVDGGRNFEQSGGGGSESASVDSGVVGSFRDGKLQSTLSATFSRANVLALALREQSNVFNVQRRVAFTFNSSNQVVRIDATGDL